MGRRVSYRRIANEWTLADFVVFDRRIHLLYVVHDYRCLIPPRAIRLETRSELQWPGRSAVFAAQLS